MITSQVYNSSCTGRGPFLVKDILSPIYQWYMTGIYLVYTWYIPRLFSFWFWVSKCIEIKYKTICYYHHNLAPACTYKCQCGRHVMYPQKAGFTGLVHMTGIYQVYVCHIWSTSASWPSCFLQRARPPRRDVSDLDCLNLRFQRLKARRFEAGACQSSTASSWSRKRDCPCEIPGLIRQHSRIQRPASV